MNDDLISRSELKKALNFVYDCDYIGSKSKEGIASDIIDVIDNAPTVCNDNYSMGYQDGVKKVLSERPHGEWIPVSKRLPDLFEVVLVTDETNKVFEYERRPLDEEGNVCEEWTFLGRKIIAWMPLPEPYKEADND